MSSERQSDVISARDSDYMRREPKKEPKREPKKVSSLQKLVYKEIAKEGLLPSNSMDNTGPRVPKLSSQQQ